MRTRIFLEVVLAVVLVAVFALPLLAQSTATRELWKAIQKNDVPAVNAALKKGADVNAISKPDPKSILTRTRIRVYGTANDKGTSALFRAVFNNGTSPVIVQVLLKKGAQLEAKDIHGMTPLMWAAREQTNDALVVLLLKAGAKVNEKDRDGSTALIFAAGWGHLESVKRLIEKGADVKAKDKFGNTAYELARKNNEAEVVELLKPK